ncbi:HsdM N-terminal domain [Vibrio sp. B1ASS3]|nr:HsdM N-terminal domain [Vibrio sp. B1ASS3]CAE6899318.1 HsdM N-terminal domain [Vibrio sp. B1ASS3]
MLEQVRKKVDDKDASCSSELHYTEQASWMLFLKYLDSLAFIK